ncbi:exonuclease domain-containing protein [Krasilnikovia sp. MM14-A1259]|uniref:3'-5' exonuclease n=1 Tax=Krasilnikovia sp. MM14-A1259 TaxID=3373539 RepID=UPI00382AD9BB
MIDQDRAAATGWAAEVLADPTAVVLDTETTGLWGAVMVEIAMVSSSRDVLLDTLVNPQREIPEDVTAIHGITDDMVRDAPTFAELLPQIEQHLTGRRVVIYNARFDTGIIGTELCRLWHGPDAHRECGGLLQAQECQGQRDDWISRVPARIECAMEQHAAWFGDWHVTGGTTPGSRCAVATARPATASP